MLVDRQDKDGIATLTLNRPEKLNAISIPLMVELREHVDRLAEDPAVGCVVLTGAGRSFCAGHDLESIASGEKGVLVYGLAFGLILLHAAHVLGGVLPLTWATIRAWRGGYDHERHETITYLTMYWHFLDVVWLIMFAVLLAGA